EIVEVVSNNYSSKIAMRIGARLVLFVEEKGLGHVTGADGGYKVLGERYIPDVAFISKKRQPESSHEVYNPNAPDLVVEVLSPTDKPDDVMLKIYNYILAGVVVWKINPEAKTVEVYIPGKKAQRLRVNDTLDGGDVLPGFQVAVKDIFPD
ncbi:MAG TPA: Uma2 family endonuclease, partial [Aggregatilineaceae bacterium]|nr:Uma2 family endonuclease [Aggregatilineaceae bacterium]